jgi:integrase/recombinase XerC
MRDREACAADLLPQDGAEFLQYLKTQRRAAELTLDSYHRDLVRLQACIAERPLTQITSHDIRRYVGRLHAQGLGGRSLARVLSAWRGYFRWRVRHCGLALNPVDGVRPPRSPRTLPRVLSPEQAQAMLDHAPGDVLETRDRAMFELFYSSGLRLSELAGLVVGGGLDLVEGVVTVMGKRARQRTVPVGAAALRALQAWLALRPQWDASAGTPLFVTRTGTRMSPGAIRSRLVRWADRCGLGVHVHPHMLRHSFASHVLQSSGDLRAVQELLGHASIRSTQIYTHLDFQHLARIYDQAHPRAKRS